MIKLARSLHFSLIGKIEPIHLVCTHKIVCQKFISNIFSFLKAHFGYLEKQCRSRLVSFFKSWLIKIYTCLQAVYTMLNNLERATYIHLLKIASDSNFNLILFMEKPLAFSKLVSAKFDPCNCQCCSGATASLGFILIKIFFTKESHILFIEWLLKCSQYACEIRESLLD